MAGIAVYNSPGQRTRAVRLLTLIAEALGLPALETDSEEQLAAYISGANSEIGAFLRERGVTPVTETQLLRLVSRLGEVPKDSPLIAGDTSRFLIISSIAIAHGQASLVLLSASRFTVNRNGTIRVSMDMANNTSSGVTYAQIYKNDVAAGTLRTTSGTSAVTYIEDFTVKAGDALAVYGRATINNGAVSNIYAKFANQAFITIG